MKQLGKEGDPQAPEPFAPEALAARKRLGVEKVPSHAYSIFLGVAEGRRDAAAVEPTPKPGYGNGGLLLCAGDVCGDRAPEYVLAVGWYGPTGGMVYVYDRHLKKLAEHATDPECAFSLQLRDLTGDGKKEVIVWTDSHPGTGMFYRGIRVLKLFGEKTLTPVFQAYTYAQNNRPPKRQRVTLSRGKPTAITVELRDKGREVYQWDPAERKFKKAADGGDRHLPPLPPHVRIR